MGELWPYSHALLLRSVRLLQVLQAGGAEPRLLFQHRLSTTIHWRGEEATVPASCTSSCSVLLGSWAKHASLWVWSPVLVGLGLDQLVGDHTRGELIIRVLVIYGEMGTPAA